MLPYRSHSHCDLVVQLSDSSDVPMSPLARELKPSAAKCVEVSFEGLVAGQPDSSNPPKLSLALLSKNIGAEFVEGVGG